MIKLKNIVKNKASICCSAVLEDCDNPVSLTLDLEKKEFKDFAFPEGYEYCKEHISQAKRYLLSLADKSQIPHEKTIMWY